jgi:hypothetical protein
MPWSSRVVLNGNKSDTMNALLKTGFIQNFQVDFKALWGAAIGSFGLTI